MNRYFLSKLIALIAGIILVYVAYNHNKDSVTYNHNKPSLYEINGSAYGTDWSIKTTEFIGDHHKDNIKSIISGIDYVASNYKEDSEISIINSTDKKNYFVSKDLFNILLVAKDVENKSEGFYNIMLGKISSNLGFSPTFGKELFHKKDMTFVLNEKNQSIEKLSTNWFDLSSVAKGYAVQMIHDYLVSENLINHLIDIGGEIIINGNNNNEPWIVGIQNPESILDEASIIIKNDDNFLAIATSGEYRNYKPNKSGKIITHTINPNTLDSIQNNILSVTVIHNESATYADAYATAFNAMGAELALKIANENDIGLMIIILNNSEEQTSNKVDFIYSKKWYDLTI